MTEFRVWYKSHITTGLRWSVRPAITRIDLIKTLTKTLTLLLSLEKGRSSSPAFLGLTNYWKLTWVQNTPVTQILAFTYFFLSLQPPLHFNKSDSPERLVDLPVVPVLQPGTDWDCWAVATTVREDWRDQPGHSDHITSLYYYIITLSSPRRGPTIWGITDSKNSIHPHRNILLSLPRGSTCV